MAKAAESTAHRRKATERFSWTSPRRRSEQTGISQTLRFQPAAIKGASLSFADLAQDFSRVLAETRGRMFGCRLPAVDDDRCAHAGNSVPPLAALSARKVSFGDERPAVSNTCSRLLIGWQGPVAFKLVSRSLRHARGDCCSNFPINSLAMFQSADIVFVCRYFAQLTEDIAKFE